MQSNNDSPHPMASNEEASAAPMPDKVLAPEVLMRQSHSVQASRHRQVLKWALVGLVMLGLFVADTVTHYEVASAVFYIVLMVVLARALQPRSLIALTALCAGLTVLSFVLTQTGDHSSGLINLGISLCAMVLTCVLLLKIKAAQAAADAAQTQLMRLARIQSLEGLTSAIAHEINQPLAAIVTSGNACQRWLSQDPPNVRKAHESLARILADAGRTSRIVARVRSLSSGAHSQRTVFALNAALQEVLDLAQAELQRHAIHLELALAADLPEVMADRVQIQQVITNLLLNAIEALAAVQREQRHIWISTQRQEDQVAFALSDNGPGLPADGAYIFDAFWTTKEDGTGIGLSIGRSIIEAHGGQLMGDARPGGGAVFRFRLPALAKEA